MKFLKNLFRFILVVAILFAAFIFFKPQIDSFLVSKGLKSTSDLIPLPVSETIYNDNGEVMYSLSIPASYNSFISQEQLNQIINSSNGVAQISQNSDGSVSVIMTPEVREEVLGNASTACDENILAEFIGGNIISITHNQSYSEFYVVASDGASEAELFTLSGKLFAIGEIYGAIEGNNSESTRVLIYSATTGELVNTFNSNNIAGDLTGDALQYFGNSISDRFDELAERFSPTN